MVICDLIIFFIKLKSHFHSSLYLTASHLFFPFFYHFLLKFISLFTQVFDLTEALPIFSSLDGILLIDVFWGCYTICLGYREVHSERFFFLH